MHWAMGSQDLLEDAEEIEKRVSDGIVYQYDGMLQALRDASLDAPAASNVDTGAPQILSLLHVESRHVDEMQVPLTGGQSGRVRS